MSRGFAETGIAEVMARQRTEKKEDPFEVLLKNPAPSAKLDAFQKLIQNIDALFFDHHIKDLVLDIPGQEFDAFGCGTVKFCGWEGLKDSVPLGIIGINPNHLQTCQHFLAHSRQSGVFQFIVSFFIDP
jgi:hypothetical protein